MFAIDFDQVEDKQSFDSLPEGEYIGVISSAELRETRNGGAGINVQIEVAEGLLKGRYHFEWINVAHQTSQDCVKIGLQQLKQLVIAACLPTDRPFTDPSELHGKIVRFRLKLNKKNEMNTDYKPYGSSAPVAQVNAPAAKGNLVAGQKPAW